MGAGQSASSESHPPGKGLHILRVTPASPASHTTLEPFFDFVVGFEGSSGHDQASNHASIDVAELEHIVESHEEKTVNLYVWSSKSKSTRVVPITPSRQWSLPHSEALSADAVSQAQPSLLGLSMRICEPDLSLENVWHVLDVLEDSPAESAGLVPYGDWIIGWSGGVLSAENDFYDVVEAHIERPLTVFVYSYDFDSIREVVLIPNRHWGGEGLLGCVFGFGLLHRIPAQAPDRDPDATPEELLEQEFEEQELFVPADTAQHTDDLQYSSQQNGRLHLPAESGQGFLDVPSRFPDPRQSQSQTAASSRMHLETLGEEGDEDDDVELAEGARTPISANRFKFEPLGHRHTDSVSSAADTETTEDSSRKSTSSLTSVE